MRQPNLLRAVACTAFLLAISTSSNALAQGANCECVVPSAVLPAAGPIGQVTDVSGNNITLIGQPGPIEPGVPLQRGDQLIVGAQSSASFSIGDCALRLNAQTTMSLQALNGNVCVAVADSTVQTTGLGNNAPLALFGGTAAIWVAPALFDRRAPVSP